MTSFWSTKQKWNQGEWERVSVLKLQSGSWGCWSTSCVGWRVRVRVEDGVTPCAPRPFVPIGWRWLSLDDWRKLQHLGGNPTPWVTWERWTLHGLVLGLNTWPCLLRGHRVTRRPGDEPVRWAGFLDGKTMMLISLAGFWQNSVSSGNAQMAHRCKYCRWKRASCLMAQDCKSSEVHVGLTCGKYTFRVKGWKNIWLVPGKCLRCVKTSI